MDSRMQTPRDVAANKSLFSPRMASSSHANLRDNTGFKNPTNNINDYSMSLPVSPRGETINAESKSSILGESMSDKKFGGVRNSTSKLPPVSEIVN